MRITGSLLAAATLFAGTPVLAQQQTDWDAVEITTQQIAPGIAVLFGQGGNIAVSHGPDGTVMIDDQFAELSDKIAAAVAALGAQPVGYLINTHWHFDHAGGNQAFGEKGAQIFAHHNVRKRLMEGSTTGRAAVPPAPPSALPILTYEQGIRLHLNGDTIDVMFTGGGHTDGDSVVFWREDNVVHMGDLYFKIPGYPFIDRNSGGSVLHAMNSLDTVIRMIDDETKVIPGHGPMSNKAELVAYRAFVGEAVDDVRALREQGMSADEVVAANPFADYNRGEGFIGPEAFIRTIYANLEAAP